MASTTIHTLAYKIIGDGRQFKTEMGRVNAEIRAGKAVTEAFMPAINKHQREIDALRRLYDAGRISLHTMNAAIKDQQRAMFAATTLGKAYNSVLGRMKTQVAGLVGAIASAATIRSVTNQISELERLDRAAKRAGTDIETLQRLTLAGKFEDVSQSDMINSIESMMVLISAANAGNAKAEKALASAGLTAEKLSGLTVENQFLAIADAIAKIPNANDKLRATEKILGSTGVELSNMLAGGSKGIQEQIDKVRELGNVVTKTDISKIVEADQAMDEFWVTWTMFTRDLAVTLVPIVKEISGAIKFITGRNGGGESGSAFGHLIQSEMSEQKLTGDIFSANRQRMTQSFLRQKSEMTGQQFTALTPSEATRLVMNEQGVMDRGWSRDKAMEDQRRSAEIERTLKEMLTEMKNQNLKKVNQLP